MSDERTNAPSSGDDMLYEAWVVIANVSGGDWDEQPDEWRQAAERWRERWHSYLAPDSAAPDESEGVTRCGREDCAFTGYPAAMASHRRLSHGPRRSAPDTVPARDGDVEAAIAHDFPSQALAEYDRVCSTDYDDDVQDAANAFIAVSVTLVAALRVTIERRDEYKREWESACERETAAHHLLAEEQQRRQAAEADAQQWKARAVRVHDQFADDAAGLIRRLKRAIDEESDHELYQSDNTRNALIDADLWLRSHALTKRPPATSADPDRGGTAA
jgi:hypothetical protein